MIVVAPIFDDVTEITYDESRQVVKYAKEHNVQVIDLTDKEAVKSKVEQTLIENPGILVYHADHGNETSWLGDDQKACVSLDNVECLSGRSAYCNNCSSAAKLGVEAWKLGATYWGYTDVFTFTTDALEDFEEFINNGIRRRIDGWSWKQCLEATKELANQIVDKLIQAGKALAASCLRWDRDHLVCYNEDMPPEETDCPIRKIGIKVLGKEIGWKLSRMFAIGTLAGVFGLGVIVHDFMHQVWELKGTVYSVEGGYIGLGLTIIGFAALIADRIRWVLKCKRAKNSNF